MDRQSLLPRLQAVLKEDQAWNDATTRLLPGLKKQRISAQLISRNEGIFCGAFLLKPIFNMTDPRVRIRIRKKDGGKVRRNQVLAELTGRADGLLAAERSYLNLASKLSGIATLTRQFVEKVRGTGARILDTRKTTPLWRDLEKFAVRCGGGENHRFSLDDAILVKDNHLGYLRRIGENPKNYFSRERILKSTKRKPKFIEFEASDYADVWEGIRCGADIIMLDNMGPDKIRGAVQFIHSARKALKTRTPYVEISGGVRLDNVKTLAKLGVDRISIGALTHSAPALDLSLEVK